MTHLAPVGVIVTGEITALIPCSVLDVQSCVDWSACCLHCEVVQSVLCLQC